ncbi:glycerol-3-phosphate dehydrogenase/oxidase [Anaeromyxobacter sp. PSR-1]|uniref:glycerol-3-phosphate dehydrogenase/oxidase n=1 Tax=unclassified Anaeromyxobacter TaxID=2620896 RepID=UPI0005DAF182|nr:glycerol-3-phosphate dehydrogenase/oxidase [Anaeromyxobacter sp. PSR-1]GAO05030.1 anaerobic glycerol-3-phosphate dehydrogenase subunit A [Anaeromyxobacter sp. PSR-1]
MGEHDVIIVGGGVNGTGTARDCAMRGLRVLLLEKSDFGVGASGNSSGMIHGGIRYMLSDRKVTELACRDSGYIQRIAPHLLFRIPFLMPFGSRAEGATLAERAAWYATEVYVGTYDLYQPLKRGRPSTRLTAEELYRLEPGLRPGLHGAVTLDEWGIDAFRLCALNALSARAHGAELRTWTEVRQLLTEGGRVRGVRWRDALTGEEGEARAPVVFNAAGAWSPALARASGVRVPMRPGKGVHLTLDRRWSSYGVICTAVDGRQMFLMPHENESIVGTTDDDWYGDPDDLEATQDEVEYLLEGAASLVPGVRRARITRAWCGLRTTVYAYGPNEDALSREHQLLDGAADGAAGLLSIVGGKLASYRAQSEEAADRIEALLGRPVTPCRTHQEPLPGGDEVPDPAALAREFPVDAAVAARLVYRHGGRAREICGMVRDDRRLGLVLCRDEGILAAEVVYCARHEQVRRLQDLRRRCRLAVGACGGLDCARVGAQLAGRELSWPPERVRAELSDLLDQGWRERRPVLDGAQLAAEELLRGGCGPWEAP